MAAVVIIAAIVIYASFSPLESALFPKCPFLWLTGFECPGCGSQRALHSLFTLNFADAFFYNPLAIIALPYIALGLGCEATLYLTKGKDSSKARQRAVAIKFRYFGSRAVKIAFTIIALYFIGRNIW